MAGGFTTKSSIEKIPPMLDPLRVQSLKEACILRLENMILSGEFKIGARLPSERDLAERLKISRPVLHEALVDLALKGLVRIAPRRGVFVNDYRKDGSCAILSSLLSYNNGEFDPQFTQSLLDMRINMEVECARLAALRRTSAQVEELKAVLISETAIDRRDVGALTELDFKFHLFIAIASGNLIYPLIINSFKGVYTHLTNQFFTRYVSTPIVEDVLRYHQYLVEVIQASQPDLAANTMNDMLKHGEKYLKGES
jgi:GntR family transcriptional regulator, transcriptional repressor for pyruvate dehydrogenase complex